MLTLFQLSISLVGGLLLSRAAKALSLPAVTAYLVCGLLIGPYCIGALNLTGLGFTTPESVARLDIISQVALGFIAFTIQYDPEQESQFQATAAVLLSTLLSAFTIPLWAWVLEVCFP